MDCLYPVQGADCSLDEGAAATHVSIQRNVNNPLTHALVVIFAISLVNLRKLESFRRPPTAPPSSIRSHRNWHNTCTCWMVRKLEGMAPMTEERYWTAFDRTATSSSLMYSPSDCTTSIRDVCLDSSSVRSLVREQITAIWNTHSLRFGGQSARRQPCRCRPSGSSPSRQT